MEHEVSWDEENGCVRVAFVGPIAPEHARAVMAEAHALLEGKRRRLLLIDHRRSREAVPSETREAFETNRVPLDKLGFFGMNNFTRITAKIAVVVAGHSHYTKFFKTEAEALAWLRE